jgi:hypothetical protein
MLAEQSFIPQKDGGIVRYAPYRDASRAVWTGLVVSGGGYVGLWLAGTRRPAASHSKRHI